MKNFIFSSFFLLNFLKKKTLHTEGGREDARARRALVTKNVSAAAAVVLAPHQPEALFFFFPDCVCMLRVCVCTVCVVCVCIVCVVCVLCVLCVY